jgi:probable RNA-binding protein EIF1AD
MSRARKHVEEEILSQFPLPKENERVVVVRESRGRNTLEVAYPDESTILALIPAKFQKKIWIKKGNFVIIEPTFLPGASSKVLAVVTHCLFPDDIQHLIAQGHFPAEFLDLATASQPGLKLPTDALPAEGSSYLDMEFMSGSDDEEDLEEAFGHNPNRHHAIDAGSDDDDEDDSS